jgi:hypothetical protein
MSNPIHFFLGTFSVFGFENVRSSRRSATPSFRFVSQMKWMHLYLTDRLSSIVIHLAILFMYLKIPWNSLACPIIGLSAMLSDDSYMMTKN